MYCEFFGLQCEPFDNTNNSNFFYPSDAHKEALAGLLYVIKTAKGLSLLTGEIGAGKTQVAQVLKEMLRKDNNNLVCEVVNPKLADDELLQWLAKKIDINPDETETGDNDLFDTINQELIQRTSANSNFRIIVIFDEAQLLSQDVFEKIRLLSNLEFNHKKLLQIVLIGQPELKKRLEQYINRPLMQRISIHKDLSYFDEANTRRYIQFRLDKAGCTLNPFSEEAIKQVYLSSDGSPRLINMLCDNCLFIGFSKGQTYLDHTIIGQSVAETPGGAGNNMTASLDEPIEQSTPTVRDRRKSDSANIDRRKPLNEVQTESHHEEERDNNVPEFPIPTAAPPAPKTPLLNQFWVKAFAALIALFVLLWIYEFFRSSSEVSRTVKTDPSVNTEEKQVANSASRLSNQPNFTSRNIEATPKRYQNDEDNLGAQSQNVNLEYRDDDRYKNYNGSADVMEKGSSQYQENVNRKGNSSPEMISGASGNDYIEISNVDEINFPFNSQRILFDMVTVEDGYSVSKLAFRHYGVWNPSIEDIINQANPALKDFSKIQAGIQIKFPKLAKHHLYTQTSNGEIYVYYGSYANELNALRTANIMTNKGSKVTLQKSTSKGAKISRVYLGPFTSSDKANQFINKIEFKSLGGNQ